MMQSCLMVKMRRGRLGSPFRAGAKVIKHGKKDHISLMDAEGEYLMHFTRDRGVE